MPEPKKPAFDPKNLDKSTIAVPLLEEIRLAHERARAAKAAAKEEPPFEVIIDVNLLFHEGREEAQQVVMEMIEELLETPAPRAKKRRAVRAPVRRTSEVLHAKKSKLTRQYVFARLRGDTILELVALDKRRAARAGSKITAGARRAIFRIWPDFEIRAHTCNSIATVKADAAHRSFQALGADVVWAVVDSGIDKRHPHFATYANLDLPPHIAHRDFTTEDDKNALVDDYGHGTHVAGIIAGAGKKGRTRAVARRKKDESDADSVEYEPRELAAISGMAPQCKLVSLKALDEHGGGRVSNVIAALSTIQETNGHGRKIHVHGVNLSVGYDFDAEWFACGQSPLCIEVDRLVQSGVVVVVAAGNTGYGELETMARGAVKTPLALSINDPGNAELAITVGSTHRDMPHVYGVSYFSSKGPTGDGRPKPDLVAPGEKILSCAAGAKAAQVKANAGTKKGAAKVDYIEDSGTSMAAPHVSGVVAGFLSVRREFIGRPTEVKQIFCSSATDLKRERYFQGHGLVDLMRAIQSV